VSQAEIDYYAALPSVAEALRRAGRAERPDGKRHPHQTRITRTALGRAGELLASLRVNGCKSFEELHSLYEEALGVIHGVGPLFVYDTALRVGGRLGLAPRYVFLHAGVRKGAAALGLGRGRDYLSASELPSAFRRLEPREIEDCLCIYKAHIVAAVSG
jgi:hypothetical protein